MSTYKKICITNRQLVSGDYLDQIELVAKMNVDLLILREKDLTEAEYESLARDVIAICEKNGVQCVLHTFVEVAKRIRHPYIHLPMPAFLTLSEEDKAWFQVIGVSTHSVEEAKICQEKGATYITASHIFETACKEGLEPRGLRYLKDVLATVDIDVYALGGIHPDNIQQCVDAGAKGVCMMSDYMKMNFDRYERQMIVPGIGEEGQMKLKKAKVLVVGAGGLGSPVLQYLAGAGVGKIGVIDADEVSVSNIHRQVLHPMANVGINKAESAKEGMLRINDGVVIQTYPFFLTAENAPEIFEEYDFVIDCVDNFEAKFLINDVCVLQKKAFCHAGVLALHGQVLTYVPGEGNPCYRCVFEEIPKPGEVPNSTITGIIGPMAGAIGCIQAIEAIKYITGIGELLTKRMMVLDGLTMKTRIVPISEPMEECRVCGPHADIKDMESLREYYSRISIF